jgi:PBP1b-binding outer membrane lipoprotein LpoB
MQKVVALLFLGLILAGCSAKSPGSDRHADTMDRLTQELDDETRQ